MNRLAITKLSFGSLFLALQSTLVLSQAYPGSGSTGSDGALAFPNAKTGDIILFDPTTYKPPLDPVGDGVFNFTTISIPAGVTVRLSGQVLHGPVYWLASGNVDIEGTLDLSGSAGAAETNLTALRIPAPPGAGGYVGGVGGDISTNSPAEPGLGPIGGSAGHNGNCPGAGFLGANSLLVPLFGGSGAGGIQRGTDYGQGGGAGGGAILIASSSSITVNGAITVNGGPGVSGGAGGAIRLVAQTISGSGTLQAVGGGGGCAPGGVGIIRLEAYQFTSSFSENGNVTSGTPFATFVPTANNPVPAVRVISVGGMAVNPNPTGSFTTPDVTVNSSAALAIVVQGSNVPLGTVVHLQIYSDNGPDIVMDTPGLTGTVESSKATVSVMFPPGYSRGFISASFSTGGSTSGATTSAALKH